MLSHARAHSNQGAHTALTKPGTVLHTFDPGTGEADRSVSLRLVGPTKKVPGRPEKHTFKKGAVGEELLRETACLRACQGHMTHEWLSLNLKQCGFSWSALVYLRSSLTLLAQASLELLILISLSPVLMTGVGTTPPNPRVPAFITSPFVDF